MITNTDLLPQRYHFPFGMVKDLNVFPFNNDMKQAHFIWGGGINQIDRKVCCLGIENGGMGMINIQEFIDSKRIKFLHRILHEPLESWNAIGKVLAP